MTDFLLDHYLWIKASHVIAIIAWMAGMLYLPRLFVYHVESTAGGEAERTFVVMERRLLRLIINPAMAAAWILGLLMLWLNPPLLSEGWMHVKLTGVVALSGLHGLFSVWRRRLERGERPHSARFYRIINEVPALLMVVIVLMAVPKAL